jgi:hypothetical protein
VWEWEVACNNCTTLDDFKWSLNKQFELVDSGAVGFSWVEMYTATGLNKSFTHLKSITWSPFWIKLICQAVKPARYRSPLGFWPIPATDNDFAEARRRPYPRIVGYILYASIISRPDLSQPASVLSQFISKWSKTYYQAAKHLLRYIRGTTDLCLVIDGNSGKHIVQGYADTVWRGNLITKRSTTDYIFKFYGGTIAWKSWR